MVILLKAFKKFLFEIVCFAHFLPIHHTQFFLTIYFRYIKTILKSFNEPVVKESKTRESIPDKIFRLVENNRGDCSIHFRHDPI